jgi:hypothetical protein
VSAETLREAARLMRERAEAATRGPWHYPPTRGWRGVVMSRFGCLWAPARGRDGQLNHEPDGVHIASWHPTVALAVADMLDNAAQDAEMQGPDGELRSQWDMRVHLATTRALAVARAYLGETP